MGRPTKYTTELGEEICRRMENGETLLRICRDEHMPDRQTIFNWAKGESESSREFFDRFARARELQAHAWADQCIDISDDSSADTITDENGNERTNHEVVARSKLKIETRRWLAGKVLPQVYGDRAQEPAQSNVLVLNLTAEEARATLERRGAVLLPESRGRLLADPVEVEVDCQDSGGEE